MLGQEQIDDAFAIDEVTMFEGEDWSDKKYAVAGDILDGYLYDLFMNMLEDRGINKDFADQVSNFCSAYEHTQYINMLEDLQKFIK
jgi:complement component 1 Q subcomponent-binding protein